MNISQLKNVLRWNLSICNYFPGNDLKFHLFNDTKSFSNNQNQVFHFASKKCGPREWKNCRHAFIIEVNGAISGASVQRKSYSDSFRRSNFIDKFICTMRSLLVDNVNGPIVWGASGLFVYRFNFTAICFIFLFSEPFHKCQPLWTSYDKNTSWKLQFQKIIKRHFRSDFISTLWILLCDLVMGS